MKHYFSSIYDRFSYDKIIYGYLLLSLYPLLFVIVHIGTEYNYTEFESKNMRVCKYIHTCVYVCVCVFIYIYIYTHVRARTYCMFMYVRVCIDVYIYAYK